MGCGAEARGEYYKQQFQYTPCTLYWMTNSCINSEVEKELQEWEANDESGLAECVEFTDEDTN